MIRFTLKCSDGHSFESWFQSGDAFDGLQARGLVTCALCGSASVEKAIMAPRVASSKTKAPEQEKPGTPDAAPMPVSGPLSPDTDVAQAMARLREAVEKNSDYVGTSFTEEARKMHLGDAPERAIHGEAKLEDAKALIEDGVKIVPLPFRTGPKPN